MLDTPMEKLNVNHNLCSQSESINCSVLRNQYLELIYIRVCVRVDSRVTPVLVCVFASLRSATIDAVTRRPAGSPLVPPVPTGSAATTAR